MRPLIRWTADRLDETLDAWFGWSTPPVALQWRTATGFDPIPNGPTGLTGDEILSHHKPGGLRDINDVACWRCGRTVGPCEVTESGCSACRSVRSAIDATIRLGPYADDLAVWIRRLKYGGDWPMGLSLGRLLGERVGARLGDPARLPAPLVVVPMPMPWGRRLRRGIDHAWVLARGVAAGVGAHSGSGGGVLRGGRRLRPVSAVRVKSRPPQAGRSATDRRREGGAGMRVGRAGGGRLAGRLAILVDDVRTTGGSLEGLARVVRGAGASGCVSCVVAVRDAS
jgi:predicted amidophosphoribosyltransferase